MAAPLCLPPTCSSDNNRRTMSQIRPFNNLFDRLKLLIEPVMENVLHVEGQSRRSTARAAGETFCEGHVKVEVRSAFQWDELDTLDGFDSVTETRPCDESDGVAQRDQTACES